MEITEIKTDKKQYLELLLLADEQESMIDRYLERGTMHVMHHGTDTIGIAVVTDEGNKVCELKNLAIAPSFQRHGYGREMISYLCRLYSKQFTTMMVGTGNSIQTVSFYKSCGFTYSHTVPDFFTLHYDHPIIEDGKVLTDMIYFKKIWLFPHLDILLTEVYHIVRKPRYHSGSISLGEGSCFQPSPNVS